MTEDELAELARQQSEHYSAFLNRSEMNRTENNRQ